MNKYICICPYCNNIANREEHARKGMNITRYVCPSCGAYVAAHSCGFAPMGYPGDKETHKLRGQAHRVFECFCKKTAMSKKKAYFWLSNKLNIPMGQMHFAQLSLSDLKRSIKIMNKKQGG